MSSGAALDADGTRADEAYFEAYDELAVHSVMVSDSSRVGAYAAAIVRHRTLLEGRVVLDVGAGSGILSLLAAKHGGAARVYAVEAAPGMARLARALAERNGLSGIVRVLEGRAEEVELPEKVDVLISEWMGFYLVHESMLESVLVARDRWLKPGGLMLPSSARIWVPNDKVNRHAAPFLGLLREAAPVEAEPLRLELEAYSCLHGLDVSPMGVAELARRCREPQIEVVEPGRLLAEPVVAVDLVNLGELPVGSTRELVAEFNFVALRTGRAAAVALWFDVGFGPPGGISRNSPKVTLSTAPGAPPTHWKQTVVYLGVFAPVEAGGMLSAQLTLRQSAENPRQYDITVEC